MTKEELIRDEDYTEEEAERIVLQNKLDKANERIEELEDNINTVKNKLIVKIEVNNRCLKEQTEPVIRRMLEFEIRDYSELLELLKSDE